MLLSKNFRVISDSLLCFGCLLVYPHFLSGFFFKKPFRLQIFKIFFQYSVFKVRKSTDVRFRSPFRFHPVGLSGLEPPTSRLSGVRSNRLSYKPFFESGSHLLSHAVPSIVPSAAQVLTIVFGMRTGVSPERIATGNLSLSFLLVQSRYSVRAAFPLFAAAPPSLIESSLLIEPSASARPLLHAGLPLQCIRFCTHSLITKQ